METTEGQPTDDQTEPGRQTAADRRTTEERPEKEGRRADNARRPFLAMKEAARSSRSRASGRSTGNPRQQRRPTARQPDGQTATSRGRPVYKPRKATTSSRAAAKAAEHTEANQTPAHKKDAARGLTEATTATQRGRRYCDAPLTPAALASPKNTQTAKIFFGPFRFARGLRRSFS